MKILVLGGTRNARILANQIVQNHEVIYSIAGTTRSAYLPKGVTNISGGFGGADGLSLFLQQQNIDLCVDATHPFAENITNNAILACDNSSIRILQFTRKPWEAASIDDWQTFATADQLIKTLPLDATILLTIGGQNILPYLMLKQSVIARMIEAPLLNDHKLPEDFEILLSRPPFMLTDEKRLMQQHNITHLVCKNSGGQTFDNKLLAARDLGIKIFMLAQPANVHLNRCYNLADLVQAIDA